MSKDKKDLVEETNNVIPMSAPQTFAAGEKLENASHAHGTLLEYSLNGTEWVKLANLKNVTPPNVTTDEIETTDHDSNGWKEFIAGLKDGGSMPFSINVNDETNVTKMFELAQTGNVVKWRITAPTKPKKFIVELQGFVKSFNLDELVSGNAVTASGEIRNSGEPTFGWEA